VRPCLEKLITKKAGGVAQGRDIEFKPQSTQKKKKNPKKWT
jgi:hypothetical protein